MVEPVHRRGDDHRGENAFEPLRHSDIAVLENGSDRVNGAVSDENHAGDCQGHGRKRQHQSDDDKLERVMAVTGADIDLAIGVVQRMAAP